MSRSPARSLGPTALAALILAGAAPAAGQESSPLRQRTVYEDLQMFSQVLNQIRVNHPDTLDTHDLFMAAIEGMVAAADPHSYVIPYTRFSPEKEEQMREGRLVPVPVSFRFIGGAPVVVSVAPGSKAAALDVIPGDRESRLPRPLGARRPAPGERGRDAHALPGERAPDGAAHLPGRDDGDVHCFWMPARCTASANLSMVDLNSRPISSGVLAFASNPPPLGQSVRDKPIQLIIQTSQPYEELECWQKQGAHGAHGLHFFVTHDSDNAFLNLPAPTTEIDARQWQFAVPMAAPTNVGEAYGNVVRAPLVPVVTPLP